MSICGSTESRGYSKLFLSGKSLVALAIASL